MNKKIFFNLIKKNSYFIWLLFLIFFTIFVTYFYDLNKKNQINEFNNLLKNIYFTNSLKKITTNLKPRYIYIEHIVKDGDTYDSIINKLKIPNI